MALTQVYPSLSIVSSTHSRNGSLPLEYPAIGPYSICRCSWCRKLPWHDLISPHHPCAACLVWRGWRPRDCHLFAVFVDPPILAAWGLAEMTRSNFLIALLIFLNFREVGTSSSTMKPIRSPGGLSEICTYFNGDVEFKGDTLKFLEFGHDWTSFRFAMELIRCFLTLMIPELIIHTRSEGG